MSVKPKHNAIDPFPMFTTEEMNYYHERNRLFRGVVLLDCLKSVGPLIGEWVVGLQLKTPEAIPRKSPSNLPATNTADR